MKLRGLVDILAIKKLAPIHFWKSNSENIYPECKHMTDEELNDYLKGYWTNEKEYDEGELGIYMPDITVEYLYDNEAIRNPANFNRIFDDIYNLYSVAANDERYKIIFATFVVLHEVGHWINFKKSGMTSLDYSKWDSQYRCDPIEYSDNVRKMSDINPIKYQCTVKALEMYKNIPSEKLADEYAFENLEKSLKLLEINIKGLN